MLRNLPQVDPPYPSMICQPPLQLPVSEHSHLRSNGKMVQDVSFPSCLAGFLRVLSVST